MAKTLTNPKPEPSGRFSTAPSLAIARQICSNDTASAATADLVALRLCEACLDVEAASIMLFE